MKWNYVCPICNQWRQIDWSERNSTFSCHIKQAKYKPPNPSEQIEAFVATHEWPQEMEYIVTFKKGKLCTVPGCKKKFETLDHRIPWSKKGPTSVKNLYPMCNEHNQSKGDSDYSEWIEMNLRIII